MNQLWRFLVFSIATVACSDSTSVQSPTGPSHPAGSQCPNYVDPSNCPPFATMGNQVVSGSVYELTSDPSRRIMTGTQVWAWVQLTGHGFEMAPVVTDGMGAFRFENVPEGIVILEAMTTTFDQPCAAWATTVGRDAQVSIELVSRALPLPALALGSPTITGTVFETTPQGRAAIPGATVDFEWSVDLPTATTTTDSAGRYRLCGLPVDARADLYASKLPFALTDSVVAIAGKDLILDLELRR
jgi:hypothetical protein